MSRAASVVAAAALGLGAVVCTGAPAPPPPAAAATQALEFIADDAPRALAEAKTRSVPVFVEAWAPW